MDNLDAALTGGREAQQSVIGSMLIDERCVPLVLSKLGPDDFVDGKCRATFTAIRKLAREGRPVDLVTVLNAMQGGANYSGWMADVMNLTPTAANVEYYMSIVQEKARLYRFRELCRQGADCLDLEAAGDISRKITLSLSNASRMPRMTGEERFADVFEWLKSPEKPKYLPWGIPMADRAVYAEPGDMILLGGYASSGKTLLSITMAMAQVRAGYKVGYYSFETSPRKMTVRQLAALSGIPLSRIKEKQLSDDDWPRVAEACNVGAGECAFPAMQASGFTVDDVIADAVSSGYQVIYVDYVQQLRAAGLRQDNPRIMVTEVSQRLKRFAQSTGTAVVALAQLSRPDTIQEGKGENKRIKMIPPSMHSFKESGQLEQDADVAFLLWPKDPNDNTSNRILKIGKNKEGPRPRAELVFHGDTQTMAELEEGPDYSVATQMSNIGRAVQQRNHAAAQAKFSELRDGDGGNPFA